jgi:DNA-binding CsgD family transcriptional regulator
MYVHLAREFASQLTDVETSAELDNALRSLSRQLGFDHFALSLEFRSRGAGSGGLLLHDYPEEWARVYVGFELSGRDPIRRACDRTFIGFAWDSLHELVPLTRGDRQMLRIGRECGIGDGFTVPRHLPGLARGTCTFVVNPDRRLPTQLLPLAELIGALALSRALVLSGDCGANATPSLTDRQRECVLWVARGKTAAETATILGIGTETVIQHLKLARERYRVHCKQSLIVSALFDGVIGLSELVRWGDRE